MPSQTVTQFITDSYQLISANSPTVPLYDGDMSKGLQFLNELLQDYSGNGLMITVAKTVTFNVAIGQEFVTFGAPDFTPTPNVTIGRLANLENAWLLLDGVTYPLIDESRNVFYGSYKYDPQLGLPRFCIVTYDTDVTTMRLYPAPSQIYTLTVYAKFELLPFVITDTMAALPRYYMRYLKLALAYELAFYKGRSAAWDNKLQKKLDDAEKVMASISTINLVIDTGNESYLNGSWRVKAGV
jgi:hypothetical protein